MSRRGEICIECESDDCYAEVIYRPETLGETIDDLLEQDGWRVKDGHDYCPECVKEENPRERGDDDGVEYADPRDHRDGLE
jgi:hypothetical protein